MPILSKEPDLHPVDLLERAREQLSLPDGAEDRQCWYALYTLSRREKALMRSLQTLGVPFYSPLISRRFRSPGGRLRTSYQPLFSNYVFVYGRDDQRYEAVSTGCVSRWLPVDDGLRLTEDLARVRDLIATGHPLQPETRIMEGQRVRVKSGTFAGFEGLVVRRERETRLLVYVDFMQQGASVLLDDCAVEAI